MRIMPRLLSFALLLLALPAGAEMPPDIEAWQKRYASDPNGALRQVRGRAARIAEYRAIIALSESAPEPVDGRLAGVPVLVKDNIETEDLPTTAGSLALADSRTGRNAPAVARLLAAGAIMAGKANLSEWANFRSTDSSSGWSAVGGQTLNAHDPTRSPCGSSSGSAVAVALGVVPAALGTETNGSVTCPASVNGIVGFKPTVGAVSQEGVVPISVSQDTVGPMTLTVADAALLFSLMSRLPLPDPLVPDAPMEIRVGVLRPAEDMHPEALLLYERAKRDLARTGITLVEDLELTSYDRFDRDTYELLLHEFHAGIDRYLVRLPDPERSRWTLADLVAFNEEHAERELAHFDQDIFDAALAIGPAPGPAYEQVRGRIQATARGQIDGLLDDHDLDALVAITRGPAWKIDLVLGDRGGPGFSTFPAVAGTPHLTVPMGAVEGLPVGLSVTAGRGDDRVVLSIGALYEAVRSAAMPVPEDALTGWIDTP